MKQELWVALRAPVIHRINLTTHRIEGVSEGCSEPKFSDWKKFLLFLLFKLKLMIMRGGIKLLGLMLASSLFLTACLNSEPAGNEFEEQWIKDTTAIGIYVRSNGIPAYKDVSGVYFHITQAGSGFPPTSTSSVRFGYKLSLLGSTSSVQESASLLENISNLVPGTQIGLSMMLPGSKAVVFIPSGYAYGGSALPGIPANSNLKFELELLEVPSNNTAAVQNQLSADVQAIDAYIATNNIEDVIEDPSGIRYKVQMNGSGPTATLYNKVRLNYTGKLLTTGTTFFTGSNEPSAVFDSRVINYIYAFQAALVNMKAGSKITLYVPSPLGFGNQSVTGQGGVNIPANTNLVYELELVNILQ
ncbi:MAG: FKBP-type peptidyl-prolyl cis-trans isomerase [Cytophagales bacterium]|nr:FKBP-type peptidyl-prolyl cis-trans isomerase [Cytophagales bacterium]